MKKDLWDATHTCIACNKEMKKKMFKMEGIDVRGWECPHCHDSVLHQEDAQKMFLLNKLKKGLPIKIGALGNSLILRIPKEIENHYKLSKGEQITMKGENGRKLELEV